MNKAIIVICGLAVVLSSCGQSQDNNTPESVDISSAIEQSRDSEFSFIKSISTGDSSLDYAIKEYLALGWSGLYRGELSRTYGPAKALRYGNKELRLKRGETECEYFKDSIAFLEHSYNNYKRKPATVKKSLYMPYITSELFRAQGEGVEFRGYAVAVLIKPEKGDEYYLNTEDLVCVSNNGRWTFYPADFPSHAEYQVDRIQLLLSFMKNEGINSTVIDTVSSQLHSYTTDFDAIQRFIPDDPKEASILDDWYNGSRVIMGTAPGDPVEYLYIKGFENLMGVSLSESDLRGFIQESMDEVSGHTELNVELIPSSLDYIKTTTSGVGVYLLKSIMATRDRFSQVVLGRNVLLTIPGESHCKLVELSDTNQETVKDASVALTGILSKEEVKLLVYGRD